MVMKKYEFRFNNYMNFFLDAGTKEEAFEKFNKQFPNAKEVTVLECAIAEKIKGFDKLGVNAEMFKKFLVNFYNAFGMEARETLLPISIKYIKDNDNGVYLRFDYKLYGRKQWLHVKSQNIWY